MEKEVTSTIPDLNSDHLTLVGERAETLILAIAFEDERCEDRRKWRQRHLNLRIRIDMNDVAAICHTVIPLDSQRIQLGQQVDLRLCQILVIDASDGCDCHENNIADL